MHTYTGSLATNLQELFNIVSLSFFILLINPGRRLMTDYHALKLATAD